MTGDFSESLLIGEQGRSEHSSRLNCVWDMISRSGSNLAAKASAAEYLLEHVRRVSKKEQAAAGKKVDTQ